MKNLIMTNKKFFALLTAGIIAASVFTYAAVIGSFLPVGVLGIVSMLIVVALPND